MYGKWLLSPDFINKLFFRGSILGITLVTTLLLRSYGRAINPKYRAFHQDLIQAQLEYSSNNKVCDNIEKCNFILQIISFQLFQKKLHGYDFDFSAWPVDFSWTDSQEYANLVILPLLEYIL